MTRLLCALFILLALALVALQSGGISLALPLGHGPDEGPHLDYAAWLASEGLPDPRVHDLHQAQHPPAYHWLMGQLYLSLADSDRSLTPGRDPDPLVVPWYERRVELEPDTVVPDPLVVRVTQLKGETQEGPWPSLRLRTLYLLRAPGVVFAVLTAAIILLTAITVFPERRALALLTAGLAVSLPQFSATFATINNDHFNLLFGSSGFAMLLCGAKRGKLFTRGTPLLAGCLFAVGFAAKLLVLGAFVSGVILLLGQSAPSRKSKIRSLVLLALPSLLPGLWVLRQFRLMGSAHGLEAMTRHHPELLRVATPDFPMGYLEALARLIPSFLASVGADGLTPGRLWMALAAAIPVVFLAAVISGARRAGDDHDRLLCRAFLGGLLVQLLVVAYGNRDFIHIHGRYLQGLLMPGVAALVVGAPLLLRSAARPLLGGALALAAFGGVLLLHGQLLPGYHGGHAIHGIPWLEEYVDLGTAQGDTRVSSKAQLAKGLEDNRYYPRPRDRWAITTSTKAPIRVRFDRLEDGAFHLVSFRIAAPARSFSPHAVTNMDLLIENEKVSGSFSAHTHPDWPSFPVPDHALADGSVTARMRLQTGLFGGLAEMLVRRVPLSFEGVRADGGQLRLRFRSAEWERLPVLSARMLHEQRPHGPALPIHGEGEERGVALPWHDSHPRSFQFRLLLPEGPWCDMKLQPFRRLGDSSAQRGSPGLYVIDLDPAKTPDLKDALVATFPARLFAKGRHRVRLLDAAGEDVSAEFRLVIPGPDPAQSRRELESRHDGFHFELERAMKPEERAGVRFLGRRRVLLDRLVGRSPRFWLVTAKVE